jgi:hypothetical protein
VLAAAARAWGGPVFGTATSQNATNELRQAGVRVAANTTRLLADLDAIPPGSLIEVDEGSMVSLAHLAALVEHAARNGCKLVLAGDQEQLAAVVHIVLDDVPDDPLARERLVAPDKLLAKIGGGPAFQAVVDHPPGALQPLFQLGGAALGLAVVIPGLQLLQPGVTLAHDGVEPPDARGDDMRGDDPDRALIWRGAQGKLLWSQRRDGGGEQILIAVPVAVIGRQRLVGHSASPSTCQGTSSSAQ